MKNIITNPRFTKAIEWGKLISITGSAQIVVQVVGFISGILVIRLLSMEQYAYYTLANTMLGTMSVLSDGGISSGVMAQGSKVWKDGTKMGIVLATGLDLRRKFAIISLIVSIPILIYLLLHQGASWAISILIAASLIPAFFAAISDSLLQIPLKLRQSILPLQKNQVLVGVIRLLLTGVTIFAFPWAYIAILAGGIPRIYGNFKLKKIAYRLVDKDQKPDPIIRKDILKIVKRILPTSIYYAISGQITVFLISIFGTTNSVAQLGALTRFTVVFTFLNIIIDTLITPRFARIEKNQSFLVGKFIQVQILLFIIVGMLVFIFTIFSNQILWILGVNYQYLNEELFLMSINGGFALIGGVTNSLLSSKGIILPPMLFLSGALLIQILSLFIVSLEQVEGVITYGIVTIFTIYVMRIIYFIFYINTSEFNKQNKKLL